MHRNIYLLDNFNHDKWIPVTTNDMADPQAANGGTAPNMEGSCEYIEEAAADGRQGLVLQLGSWAMC